MADDHQKPSELVDARLRRAATRLQHQEHGQALDDLRAVLQHLRRIGADPRVLQLLARIIEQKELDAQEPLQDQGAADAGSQ